MTDQRIVSKSEFARMCGVSPAAITKAAGGEGPLSSAMQGGRIDANHTDAIAYLDKKQNPPAPKRKRAPAKKKATAKKAAPKKKPAAKKKPAKKKAAPKKESKRTPRGRQAAREKMKMAPPPKPIETIPDDIRKFADMTLLDLVNLFGTDTRFKDWLSGAKSIEDIAKLRIENAKKKGELISRHLVVRFLLGPIEEFHVKLLNDGSKSMARSCHAKVQAGATVMELEKELKRSIERFLRPMKERIIKGLKNV